MILNKYEAEKVIRYLQLQINEMCDEFRNEFEFLKHMRTQNTDLTVVKSDLNILKEYC